MLISKKDLLVETGISYGQLYRWKREGLIPEEWFIKQPSFTGQETFFPKAKILNRIRAITELKDRYSLEELARILSPEVAQRNFTAEDLEIIEEIPDSLIPAFIKGFDKKSFCYMEVLLMIALSQLKEERDLSLGDLTGLCSGIKDYCKEIKSTGYILVLFDQQSDYYATLYQEQAQVYFDGRLRIIKQIRLDDLSNNIKLKYRKSFQFHFDKELEDGVERISLERLVKA